MAEWLSSLWRRLRALRRRDRLAQDFHDEMAFHVAMREQQLRESGAPDASLRARRRFGSVARTSEDLRDQWALAPRFTSFLRDLGYAARTLRHQPGFALVVILTLGFGIGINTATFSIVNTVLIRPLGLPEADRLVALQEHLRGFGIGGAPFSPPDYLDVADEQRSFEGIAAYANESMELSGTGQPVRVDVARVSASLFPVLRVPPLVGRSFRADEDRPGVNVAVVSWQLWQSRLGGDRTIVGSRVTLDRQPYTVIGVMPAAFEFPRRGPQANGTPADVWLPVAFNEFQRQGRGNQFSYSVIGRLKPGVSLDEARGELAVLTERINGRFPPLLRSRGFTISLGATPLRDEIAGRTERPLLFLLAAVGLVLLVTCANIANLLLSRAASRAREVALRTALGSSRARLLQLLLAEAFLLCAAGGTLGILVSSIIVAAVPAGVTDTLPGLGGIHIDVRVLAFCAGLTIATSLLFALIPFLTVDRDVPGPVLQEEAARTTPSRRRHRLQSALVVATVTLACVLLVGAGLFVRSFAALMATDAGFVPDRVLTAALALPSAEYASAAKVRGFHTSLLDRLSSLPGVRTAALATDLPLDRYEYRTFTAEGAIPNAEEPASTNVTWVVGPYFETLGITLRRGRLFTNVEHQESRRVVIVNERLARTMWPGEDALGKRLHWGLDSPQNPNPWLTVVGIIGDVTDGPLGTPSGLHAYEPFSQFPNGAWDVGRGPFGRRLEIAVQTEAEPLALVPAVRAGISEIDPQLAIESISTMADRVATVVAPRRFGAMTLGAFAAGALLLAALGLYGLLAYTVAERRREIAVRLALGAEAATILRMVVGQGLRLVVIGLALGLAAAYASAGAVASLLFEVGRHDAITFGTVPVVLLMIASLACALPAYRASRVESLSALRGD